jgi:hypothetical protein
MAGEHLRLSPQEDTPEYVDVLIDALIEEVLIYAHFDSSTDAVNFHIGMRRAAYQRAIARKAGDGS